MERSAGCYCCCFCWPIVTNNASLIGHLPSINVSLTSRHPIATPDSSPSLNIAFHPSSSPSQQAMLLRHFKQLQLAVSAATTTEASHRQQLNEGRQSCRACGQRRGLLPPAPPKSHLCHLSETKLEAKSKLKEEVGSPHRVEFGVCCGWFECCCCCCCLHWYAYIRQSTSSPSTLVRSLSGRQHGTSFSRWHCRFN